MKKQIFVALIGWAGVCHGQYDYLDDPLGDLNQEQDASELRRGPPIPPVLVEPKTKSDRFYNETVIDLYRTQQQSYDAAVGREVERNSR